MSQIVRRKKKGRPSKADLARRSGHLPVETELDRRRSLRNRNVNYNLDYDDYLDEEEEDDEEDERRREKKKLKLVMKLDQGRSGDQSAPSQTRIESRGIHAPAYISASEDDDSERKPLKKRRVGGVDSDNDNGEEEEKDSKNEVKGRKVDSKRLHSVPGTPADLPSGISLPDKKTLDLILDKLQKKDTYGVYSEPVDPEELPDYHDVIENPMDFATVRKKLANGVYSTLEEFEVDVFLICSNAMKYNSPETIYHKQARSIQELARKKFEKLWVNFEQSEREMKSDHKERSSSLVKKQPKKPMCRTMQEPVGSDFFSGATLATVGDIQSGSYPIQGGGCEKPSNNDGLVESNASLADANLEKAEDILSGKSLPSKLGRKPFPLDENRRATYNISNQPVVRSESITTFEGEIQQLVAVGLHAEYSYARSLARFAATLGPVGWKVASQRIEQALPSGCKFGHGWVGEYEPLPTPVLMIKKSTQKESCLIEKLQSTAKLRKDNQNCKAPVHVKEHPVNGPTSVGKQSSMGSASGLSSEGKPSFFGPSSSKSNAAVNDLYRQHNFQPKNFAKPECTISKHSKLNSLPTTNQSNASLVAKFSSTASTSAPNSREMVPRNMNILPSLPFKRPDSNRVVSAEFPNGEFMNTSSNRWMTTPSSDSVTNQMGRAATYVPHEQVQGLTDPEQLIRILAENAQKQQNYSNHSSVSTPPVPSGSREESSNATAAAAHAWMSIGAGGFKQGTDSPSSPKNQISADSLYNPSRESYKHISRVRGEFSLGGLPFQTQKNSFPLQAFVTQPIHVGNEAQIQNWPVVFPQFAAADLSRFQMQSAWRSLSPHNQPRHKQDTLPPDLNIGFQSPGSPVRQSSGLLVDSQQPDLALQL
ncbi:Bromodomain containing protein [Quillaja saponaria]|uniref:Bromodomain containing protein n=1 Tax=Quillaja saponaria TaxID=32244 RepID=A0AAD7PQH5_QUISA|nr:Bromodomain containing protein [Quillaja saponaria]